MPFGVARGGPGPCTGAYRALRYYSSRPPSSFGFEVPKPSSVTHSADSSSIISPSPAVSDSIRVPWGNRTLSPIGGQKKGTQSSELSPTTIKALFKPRVGPVPQKAKISPAGPSIQLNVPGGSFQPVVKSRRQTGPKFADPRPTVSMPFPISPLRALLDDLQDEKFDHSTANWVSESNRLKSVLRLSRCAQDLGAVYREAPNDYGILRDRAIDAALHDSTRGLWHLMWRMIDAGYPFEVSSLYDLYVDRLYALHGKSKGDLQVWDRSTRLGARIRADGLPPLQRVHIAALAIRDVSDSATWRDLVRIRSSHHGPATREIYDRNIKLHLASLPDPDRLSEAYETSIKHFENACDAHHTLALMRRIDDHVKRCEWQDLERFYQWIITNCSGPDRLLTPINWVRVTDMLASEDAEGRGEGQQDISAQTPEFVITQEVFSHFAIAFISAGKPELIETVFFVDYPRMGMKPSAEVLARIYRRLNQVRFWRDTAPDLRRRLAAVAQRILSYLKENGLESTDRMLSATFELWKFEGKKEMCEKAIENWRQLQGYNIGPFLRSVMIDFLIARGDESMALEVLSWTQGRPEMNEPKSRLPFGSYLTGVVTFGRSIECTRDLIEKAVDRLPSGIVHSHKDLGVMASVYIDGGGDSDLVMDGMVPLLSGPKSHSEFLAAFLTRRQPGYMPSRTVCEAALRVLEHYNFNDPDLISRMGVMRLWRQYNEYVADSRALTPPDRKEMFIRAMELIPHAYEPTKQGLFEIVSRCLRRNDLDTDMDVMDVWHLAKERFGQYSSTWSVFFTVLRRSSRTNLIIHFLQDAWKMDKAHFFKDFWREVRDSEWLDKAGISAEQYEQRFSR